LYDQSQARRAIMQNPGLRWVVPAPTSELCGLTDARLAADEHQPAVADEEPIDLGAQ
jgi:hypothetical protein